MALDRTAADDDEADARRDRRRAARETLLITLAATAIAGVAILGLWLAAARIIRENYQQYLTSVARMAAQRIDPELHRSLRDPAQRNGPDYLAAVAPLRQMREALPDVHYLYTMVRDGEHVRFVLDAAEPGDHDGDGMDDQAALWEIYEDTEPAMQLALGSASRPGIASATDQPYADKWGSFMTGWSPLVDTEGHQYAAVGVDVDASVYIALQERARGWAIAGLLPCAALTVLLGFGYRTIRSRALAARREAGRVQHALDAHQQRLAGIIERIQIGTWVVTTDEHGARTMTVDASWAGMLGLRAGDVNALGPGKFLPAYVHPDDAVTVKAATDDAMGPEGKLIECDVRMRHADGRWIWTEVRGRVAERDAQGRVRRLVGTQMEVGGRKAMESALTESESNLRSLFELSPLGICLCELPGGKFVKVNDALLASTGYTRDELLQTDFWSLTPPQYHTSERELHATLTPGENFGPYEKEYRRKDGTTYPVLVHGLRTRDGAGREVGWAIVQDISGRKAMESELAAAAQRDRLTGLANRARFLEWLQAAIGRVRAGRQRRFAALFLDFDRFKLVNDTMGHETGDALLREIAKRLRESLAALGDPLEAGSGNRIARFGGDEFLVLLNDVADGETARQIADELLVALARPYLLNGREVYSTASIGIVTSDQCLESAEAVIRNADVAMYEAKRSGRGCAVLFDDAMRARLTRYVTIESHLRRALEAAEFSLVYQPIIDLETGQVASVEALARWHHPTLGPVSPTEFIPIAEESGLIVQLGQRVLREACGALAAWRAQDPERAPGAVCVNVSRAELALGQRLLQRISETLLQAGLPPQCLRLEVTERDAMIDPAATQQLMRELRAMGVQLAMDDFGTGTSSLGCLRDYPFDIIKIDRSFVSDLTRPDVLALIHAAITLAQNLGKTSIAEGVETATQLAVLKSLGCHFGQGWFFSRPLTHEQMFPFMGTQQRASA